MLNIFLSLFLLNAPEILLREDASSISEVVSGGYYGEEVFLIDEKDGWAKIAVAIDGHQGWIRSDAITKKDAFPEHYVIVNRLKAHVYDRADLKFGPILSLPYESRVEVEKDLGEWLEVKLLDGRSGFIQSGDVRKERLLNKDEMCSLSLEFLGLPYTWGGRSSFGYDCSGFVQMLHRQMGVNLPRDSIEQVAWSGFQEISKDDLKKGDVLFFGGDAISHVGLYLGEGKFIHATGSENEPWIRISDLSEPRWQERFKAACTLKHMQMHKF